MAERNEILNKDLLKRLAARLNMGGVRQFPSKLNTDEVLVVTSLDALQVGAAGEPTVLFNTAIRAIGGLVTDDWEVIPAQVGLNSVVESLGLVFSVPIDGISDPYSIRVYLQLPVGQPFPVTNVLEAYRSSSAAATQARFNLRGCNLGPISGTPANGFASSWDGFLPPDVPLRVDIAKAAAAFPAGSTVEWRFLVWQWPSGTARPF